MFDLAHKQCIVSLKIASLPDIKVKRKISCQQYTVSMISGHGPNSVFYNPNLCMCVCVCMYVCVGGEGVILPPDGFPLITQKV